MKVSFDNSESDIIRGIFAGENHDISDSEIEDIMEEYIISKVNELLIDKSRMTLLKGAFVGFDKDLKVVKKKYVV